MSLSYSGGTNPDLAALVGSEIDFTTRLKQLNDAKAAADKALSDLNLGMGAKAAYDDAARKVSEAQTKRDADLAALATEIKNTRDAAQTWADTARTSANDILTDAQNKLSDANSKQEEARTLLEKAKKAEADARAKADEIVSNANDQANALLADAKAKADDMIAKAAGREKAAADAQAAADASKALYDAKIKAITAVVTQGV